MEKLGEKALKKLTVGGKLADKRLCCSRISEYDLNGNIVHAKSCDGYEEWFEYDSTAMRFTGKPPTVWKRTMNTTLPET